ncbi:MAG: adenosylcobinamide-phosphate synthase CbiB [Thermoplasmata archaeon]
MNYIFIVFLFSIIIDIFGEYPLYFHPVVWIGKTIGFFDKIYGRKGKIDILFGSIFSIITIIIFLIPFIYFECLKLNIYIKILLDIYIFKSTFSIGSLIRHVKSCDTDNIDNLRKNVSKIVGRDTKNLDKNHLYSAAIESSAESITDSISGPMFYFLIFGIPGALFYRIVNTMDSMIGYKNERYFYFGKFAARLDDVLNFIPARLTSILFLPFSFREVKIALKKYRKLKINGMYTMAPMAAILKRTLEKIGYYRIDFGPLPEREDVIKALKITIVISYTIVIITGVLIYVFNFPWWCKTV